MAPIPSSGGSNNPVREEVPVPAREDIALLAAIRRDADYEWIRALAQHFAIVNRPENSTYPEAIRAAIRAATSVRRNPFVGFEFDNGIYIVHHFDLVDVEDADETPAFWF